MSKTREDMQADIFHETMSLLSKGANPCIVMPTGAGKTHVGVQIVTEIYKQDPQNTEIAVMAHLEALLGEHHHETKPYGFKAAIIKQHRPAISGTTFASPKSMSQMQGRSFNLVVIDEAHRANAKTYRDAMNTVSYDADSKVLLKPRQLLGLTATPLREDGKSLLKSRGGPFDCFVTGGYKPIDWINCGAIVKPRFHTLPWIQMLAEAGIKVENSEKPSESDIRQVQHLIKKSKFKPSIESSVDRIFALGLENQAVVGFFDTIVDSVIAVDYYNARMGFGPGTVDRPGRAVSGSRNVNQLKGREYSAKQKEAIAKSAVTPRMLDAVLQGLRTGRFKFVACAKLFVEGVDVPNLNAIVIGGKRESFREWSQMVGRVARDDGKKPRPYVIDTGGSFFFNGDPFMDKQWDTINEDMSIPIEVGIDDDTIVDIDFVHSPKPPPVPKEAVYVTTNEIFSLAAERAEYNDLFASGFLEKKVDASGQEHWTPRKPQLSHGFKQTRRVRAKKYMEHFYKVGGGPQRAVSVQLQTHYLFPELSASNHYDEASWQTSCDYPDCENPAHGVLKRDISRHRFPLENLTPSSLFTNIKRYKISLESLSEELRVRLKEEIHRRSIKRKQKKKAGDKGTS